LKTEAGDLTVAKEGLIGEEGETKQLGPVRGMGWDNTKKLVKEVESDR